MAQQHLTHEDIHKGLSTLKDDSRWRAVLNFRFSHNSTRAVPFKKKLLNATVGFHSLISGLNNWFYTIGRDYSYVHKGVDDFFFKPLWKGRVEVLVKNKPRLLGEQKLLVRGAYTGSEPTRIRVSLSRGQLFLYKQPVVVEAVEPEPITVDCGLGLDYTVRLLVRKTKYIYESGEPPYVVGGDVEEVFVPTLFGVPKTEIEVHFGRVLLTTGISNGNGVFDFETNKGALQFRVQAEGFRPRSLDYAMTEDEFQTVTLRMFRTIKGWKVSARSASTAAEGIVSTSNYYNAVVNGIVLGPLDLNFKGAGGHGYDELTISEEFEERLLGELGEFETLDISIVKNVLDPRYATDAYEMEPDAPNLLLLYDGVNPDFLASAYINLEDFPL